jgi:hypothetical protein
MGKVREKIAYLQGLKDGINLKDQDTAKLIGAVVEVLNSIADSFDEAETRLELIDDCIEDIYEDLEYLNEKCDCCDECCEPYYDEYDDFDYEEDFDDFDDDFDDEDESEDDDEEYDDMESAGFVSFICPHCEERIHLDESLFKKGVEIICPSCSNVVFEEE